MSRALVLIDFINEIAHPNGKLAAKGYSTFVEQHDVVSKVNELIGKFRASQDPIVHVTLAFQSNYSDQPKASPIFGKAEDFGILQRDTWSTQIIDSIDVDKQHDVVVVKNRVSAFCNTGLSATLRNLGVTDVFLAGIATDLAVDSAARSAHDDDFNVFVVKDACAAATTEDHEGSLVTLAKLARLVDTADVQ